MQRLANAIFRLLISDLNWLSIIFTIIIVTATAIMIMMKRLKQRKRSWLVTKLLQMKLLQQLKQSGDGVIVAVVIVFRISIAAVVVIILLIMINAIMPGMIARTTSQRRSRPSSPLSTVSTPSSPATSLWSKPSSKDSYHCDDWHQIQSSIY